MPSYAHSGRLSPRAAAVPPALLLTSAILGFVYAFGAVWIPIVGLVSMLFLLGYVVLSGLVLENLLEWAHVRSRPFAVAMALLLGAANVCFAWVAFTAVLLADVEGFRLSMALNPLFLVSFILDLNQTGWFSVRGTTPTGPLLWLLWGGEAAILFGYPAWMSAKVIDKPYCEECGTWSEPTGAVMALGENLGKDVKGPVERLDLAALAELELPCTGDRVFQLLETHVCPSCSDFATLSLVHVTVHPSDNSGSSSVTRRVHVPFRIVTRDELASIRDIAAAMAAASAVASGRSLGTSA